jgi:hypothetical protein
VGGETPPHFTLSTITSKVEVYAPAEGADTLPLFLLYPLMYSVTENSLYCPLIQSLKILNNCADCGGGGAGDQYLDTLRDFRILRYGTHTYAKSME